MRLSSAGRRRAAHGLSSYNDVALHLAPRGAASTKERDWVASVDVHFSTPVCSLVDAVNASVWIGRGAVDTVMERFDLADTFKNRAFARTPAAADVRAYRWPTTRLHLGSGGRRAPTRPSERTSPSTSTCSSGCRRI